MAATEELADFAVYRAFARLGVRYLAELRALSCNAGVFGFLHSVRQWLLLRRFGFRRAFLRRLREADE